ncbi:hypothetical protein PRN20_04595 [Devosia sp. ZB163]|uniref:hypothetical protein n=1 Tax=Devosia sp. ZB163 TaxID=3025938 RepID=UPI002362A2E6|nr:hypothetical protein [Devosia sp. ZB163]MDC9823001.1 hypothetical protein [Devosia sp. ZB163]
MSDIGKAGGHQNPRRLSNDDQSVSSSGNPSSSSKVSSSGNRSGRLEAHPVGQSSPAQVPAAKTGIGEEISKATSRLKETVSGWLGKVTSPARQASEPPDAPQIRSTHPTQAPPPSPPLQTDSETLSNAIAPDTRARGKPRQLIEEILPDVTASAPQQTPDLKTVYDTVLEETKSFNMGNFLRDKNASSPVIQTTLGAFGANFAQSTYEGLAGGQFVALTNAAYDPKRTKFDLEALNRVGHDRVVDQSITTLQDAWRRLVGSDPVTIAAAAAALPQQAKDLLATAFKAIDASQLSQADKEIAKKRICSDVLLRRVINHVRDLDGGTTRDKTSMGELSNLMMFIAGGSSDMTVMTLRFDSDVVKRLTTKNAVDGRSEMDIMRSNMFSMFSLAALQGTPYAPSK